jgi:hypothetical protein
MDVARLAAAVARPGVDTRLFVAVGTVASVRGDAGPDFTSADAVVVSARGTRVDVVLEPHNFPISCGFGVQGGSGFITTPIHAGDRVMVAIPDGDPMLEPWVFQVLPSNVAQVPIDGGQPLARNDRVAIVARGVPLDLRVQDKARIQIAADGTIDLSVDDGGGSIRITTDGQVQLGGSAASEHLLLGDIFRGAQAGMDTAIATTLELVADPFATWQGSEGAPGTGPFATTYPETATLLTAIGTACAAIAAAIQAFESGAPGYLSSTSQTM